MSGLEPALECDEDQLCTGIIVRELKKKIKV